VFVSVARTSFNYVLIGAVIGLLGGIILGSLLMRSKKR
jgi:ABC-type nitrate/sulfonate/bicarbonate transport system permease component